MNRQWGATGKASIEIDQSLSLLSLGSVWFAQWSSSFYYIKHKEQADVSISVPFTSFCVFQDKWRHVGVQKSVPQSLSHADLATCSHCEQQSACAVTLLALLSQRQGWAGATAVCLIACAMGVGSIIRAAAPPPCSKTQHPLLLQI